jgi:signal transduction histidine kinase
MRRSLFIVYGLFFISLSILGSLSFIFYTRYSDYTQYADAVEDTYRVITELNRLNTFLKDAETGQQGFLLTRDSAFLQPYLDGVINIKESFVKVKEMTSPNVSQQERISELNILIQDKLKSMDHTRYMFLFNNKAYKSSLQLSKEKMDRCRDVINRMEQEEYQLLGMRQETKAIYQSSAPEYMKALFSFSVFVFFTSFILIVREFRGRVRYQKELEEKVRELNQANTELEQIAFVASHDLQEPLRKINTFSDRLESKHAGQLNQEGKHIIARLSYASSRMRDLIEDLANYTSLVQKTDAKTKVDLNLAIEAALQLHTEEITEKNASITYENLPSIIGYSQQLTLLFDSLISNSLKFNREKVAPVIVIATSQVTSHDLAVSKRKTPMIRYTKITIRDNGIGFDEQFAEKVFGIFQRLHTQHSEYSGKGIGLAIVRRVMANHNGHVLAKGKLMEGAEFTLLFPLE